MLELLAPCVAYALPLRLLPCPGRERPVFLFLSHQRGCVWEGLLELWNKELEAGQTATDAMLAQFVLQLVCFAPAA